MQQNRWNKIESILDTALTLSGSEQTTYIDEVCEGDEDLLKEVYEILQAVEESERTHFLEGISQEHDIFINDISKASKSSFIGKKIGAFVITERLGLGGMGTVYKAERSEDHFSQQVAIKLLQWSIQSPETLQRFRQEQDILAGLQHPNIAQLYDGGVTENGIPYLIMELVNGEPIDQYCNKHRLSVDRRLQLFKKVCSALQFAHSNLVVHRDIKAQNLYVTNEGEVKVLDFGIAKLLDPTLTEHTMLQTQPGRQLWTPQYAAPEQVSGQPVTTATDVYALGVLLYKLLTDTYPLLLKDKDMAAFKQLIREKIPPNPSRAVAEAKNCEEISKHRETTPLDLAKTISGDLDAIVQKTLRKEPEFRYHSIAQLVEDLERYQHELPVQARKDTAPYRIQKFYRRHKTGIAISVAMLLILAGLTGFYSWKITRERNKAVQQQKRAEQQALKARQITNYLTGIFNFADPEKYPDKDVTVREALDQGVDYIHKKVNDQPDIKATLLDATGNIYIDLGDYDKTGKLLHEALQIRKKLYEKDHSLAHELATSLSNWGNYNSVIAHYDTAKKYLHQAANMYQAAGKQKYYAASTQELGWVNYSTGDYSRADSLVKLSLKLQQRLLGSESKDVGRAYQYLGWIQNGMGHYDTADSLFQKALSIRRTVFKPNHPLIAQTLQSRGRILYNKKDYTQAREMENRALAIQHKIYEPDHPDIATTLNILGLIEIAEQNYAKAESLLNKCLAIRTKKLGENDPEVAKARNDLATIYYYRKQYNRAADEFKQVVNINKKILGSSHPEIATGLNNLALSLQEAGKKKQALIYFKRAIAVASKNYSPSHPHLVFFRNNIAKLYEELGGYQKAIPFWLQNYHALKSSQKINSSVARDAVKHLAKCFKKVGNSREAQKYKVLLAKTGQ